MSKATALIRKSEGDKDDVSLPLQRDQVTALASDLANDVDVIALGVHTGFRVHMRPNAAERIDNKEVLSLLESLQAGEYDYLVAWDDTRLARDQFYLDLKPIRPGSHRPASTRPVARRADG